MAALPNLTHIDLDGWFGSDGRSDSLAAACLAALEEPQVMGGSRLGVLAQVQLQFRPLYEKAFGPWPTKLNDLADGGRPAATQLKLPLNIAAQGLATLGFFPLLNEILEHGTLEHTTPAVEFSRRAFTQSPVPAAWTSAFTALSPEVQTTANQAYAHIGQALAAYLTGLTSDDSPYDQFAARLLQGRSPTDALGEGFGATELIGLKLFTGPGQCQHCHSGPRFSDGLFHNIGLPQHGPAIAVGRAAGLQVALADPFNCKGAFLAQPPANATSACRELRTATTSIAQVSDLGAFKTPSLRNVSKGSHYMHDGRFTSLTEVVHFFNAANTTPAVGARDALVQPIGFTTEEIAAVVAFLGALSAPVRDLN
jgi:cytochrome c peroxidase